MEAITSTAAEASPRVPRVPLFAAPNQSADVLAVREVDAARMIGVSVPTLKRWRARGKGPPSTKKMGVILYPVDGLREWLNS